MKPSGHLLTVPVRRKARPHKQGGQCITGVVVTCIIESYQTATDVLIPKKLDGQIPGLWIRSVLDNFYQETLEECIRILFAFSLVDY